MAFYFPYIIVFCAASCYAMLGPIAKKVGADLPPFSFIAIGSSFMMICGSMVAFTFEREKVVAEFHNINWGWLILFASMNFIAYVGYLAAITKIPVAQYQMFNVMSPVVGGIFAYFLLKEQFEPRYLLALAFIAIGLFIAIKPKFSF
jgi:drug/metabolite transporter (DMT)-like permease